MFKKLQFEKILTNLFFLVGSLLFVLKLYFFSPENIDFGIIFHKEKIAELNFFSKLLYDNFKVFPYAQLLKFFYSFGFERPNFIFCFLSAFSFQYGIYLFWKKSNSEFNSFYAIITTLSLFLLSSPFVGNSIFYGFFPSETPTGLLFQGFIPLFLYSLYFNYQKSIFIFLLIFSFGHPSMGIIATTIYFCYFYIRFNRVGNAYFILPTIIISVFLLYVNNGQINLSEETYEAYVYLRNISHLKPWINQHFWINTILLVLSTLIVIFGFDETDKSLLITLLVTSIVFGLVQYIADSFYSLNLISLNCGRAHNFLFCFMIMIVLKNIFRNGNDYLFYIIVFTSKFILDLKFSNFSLISGDLSLLIFVIYIYLSKNINTKLPVKLIFPLFLLMIFTYNSLYLIKNNFDTTYKLMQKINKETKHQTSLTILNDDSLTLISKNNFLPNHVSMSYILRLGEPINTFYLDVYSKNLEDIYIQTIKHKLKSIREFEIENIINEKINLYNLVNKYNAKFLITDYKLNWIKPQKILKVSNDQPIFIHEIN